MKQKVLFLLFVALALNACCKDDKEPTANTERTETQKWIEEKMRDEYLWYTEIPAANKLNYQLETENFFTSLLSKKDGKSYTGSDGKSHHSYFSYIEKLKDDATTRGYINEKDSYGMECLGLNVMNQDSKEYELWGLVCYVLPGSPAQEAGVERGDWLILRNDKAMSSVSELMSGAACSFKVVHGLTLSNKGLVYDTEKTINIPASRAVVDNPVFLYTTYKTQEGKHVGYLVYNQFQAGIEGSDADTSYDDKLREISAQFADVDDFVLDLRYNNGGLLSSAVLLCNMLCPANAVGKDLGYLEYNDGHKSVIRPTASQTDIHNLNLSTLYVLTSESTASASEMVINNLRPYMKVVMIGEQTVGKNVGSVDYTDNTKTWKIHPIVCRITNSEGNGNYSNGLIPDQTLSEVFEYNDKGNVSEIHPVFPLGDPNERLFNAALNAINGQTRAIRPEAWAPAANNLQFQVVGSTLIRKATPVILTK
ncbi:MAG: hypothetical protein LBN06_00635 [Prevotellaceae bacterium]|jgi:C-terminal processing protease CtpA/Prc|nr:hypothetical protein [Prevotellaceae bacterium]